MAADITGRGTEFRFITLWDVDMYGNRTKYTFLLHNFTVLVKEHYAQQFSLLANDDLIIYKKDRAFGEPQSISGIIIERANPMIYLLKEAIADDAMDQILRE